MCVCKVSHICRHQQICNKKKHVQHKNIGDLAALWHGGMVARNMHLFDSGGRSATWPVLHSRRAIKHAKSDKIGCRNKLRRLFPSNFYSFWFTRASAPHSRQLIFVCSSTRHQWAACHLIHMCRATHTFNLNFSWSNGTQWAIYLGTPTTGSCSGATLLPQCSQLRLDWQSAAWSPSLRV